MAEQVRLLKCFNCKTIDELPDYEGNPEHDVLLDRLIADKHTNRGSGETHVGVLAKVDKKHWNVESTRKTIVKQMWSEDTGFDAEYYATRNTYREDALKCYAAHLRPQGGCPDWEHPAKLIKADTKQERKEAGLTGKTPEIYLCRFCPVASHVRTQMRAERGDYN